MGYSSWSGDAYNTVRSSFKGKSAAQVFNNTTVAATHSAKEVTLRECRDSIAHPLSTGIIVALDFTGSMWTQAHQLVQGGLGTLVTQVLEKQPVTDPAICFLAIGDQRMGDTGLQIGQFESGAPEMVADITKLVKQGGGGNRRESYLLAWYFALHKTSIDCIEKRNQKAFLFTIGDEAPYEDGVISSELTGCFGNGDLTPTSSKDLLASLEKNFEVFHLIVEEGNHGRDALTHDSWRGLLGERAILVKDVNKIPEIIMGILGTIGGLSQQVITAGFDASTTALVLNATQGLTRQTQTTDVLTF